MLDDLKRLSRGEAITRELPKRKRSTRGVVIGLIAALAIGSFAIGTTVFRSGSSLSAGLPNVVGLTESEARNLLQGFTIVIKRAHDPRIPFDRVVAQLPLATSRVENGSSVTLTLSDGPGDAIVPVDIVGKSLEDARALLTQAGLILQRTNAVDSDATPGTVIAVFPSPGSTITAGSGVVLDIASGNVKVPSLVGLTEIQARTILTQAGFLVRIVQAYDASLPVGAVIAQAPDADTVKTIGSPVTITVNTQN